MPFGCISTSTSLNMQEVFSAYYNQTDQMPPAGDAWMDIEVDVVDDIVPGLVEIVADGDTRLTQITFLQAGSYQISASFEFVRTGNANSSATIFGRRTLNGAQIGPTTTKDIPQFNTTDHLTVHSIFLFSAGDVLSFQLAYDASGDEAGLQSRTLPTGLPGETARCFSLSIGRYK
jgi:hypothetical protein